MIDIKTLRIGSHVQHHGKRKIVLSIGGDTVYLLPSSVSSVAHVAKTDEIEPIPITPALLKELGFKYRKSAGGSWCISDKKGGYFYATVASDSTCIVTHYPDFGRQSQAVCANLHELETFVYLIAKTELICQD